MYTHENGFTNYNNGDVAYSSTEYTLHGKNIVNMTQGSDSLHFFYDAQNRPAIVEWNNGVTAAKYAYIQNLQGDIVGIVDSSGTEVVKYTYNAWGRVLSATGSLASTLGTVQPFRYRGYVFDVETGLYYLRSRYYSPEWERFVNSDAIIQDNAFAYCTNSPLIHCDLSGGKCRLCEKGVALTADRYELDADESLLFSQWLSDKYPRSELQPLIEKMLKKTTSNSLSILRDKGIETAAKSLGIGDGAIAGYITSELIDIFDVIKLHPNETSKNIKEFYQEARSNSKFIEGTIIDIFGGSTETVLRITVISDNSQTQIWKDENIWDPVSSTALSEIAIYLETTFTPKHHGHPAPWKKYEEYSW